MTVITAPGQSGPGSRSNEVLFCTLQTFRAEPSPLDAVLGHTHDEPSFG